MYPDKILEKVKRVIKENDIRGLWNKELDEPTIKIIISGIIDTFEPRTIAIAYDNRTGSTNIARYISEVNQESVLFDLGFSTTPMFYFANISYNFDLGFMITASHNPPEWNGIKILYHNRNLGKEDLINIDFSKYINNAFVRNKVKTNKRLNIKKNYLNFLNLFFKSLSNTIVYESFYGMGYIDYEILSDLGVNAIALHLDPRSDFGNKIPDPSIDANLNELRKEVVINEKIGVAVDGDCDRIRFVNEVGQILSSNAIAAMIMNYAKVNVAIATTTVGKIVKDLAEEKDIDLKITNVGRHFVKSAMENYGADFGFETSGHFYYKDFYYFDSAIFTILKVLQIMKQENKTLYELIKPFNIYIEEEFKIEIDKKDEFIEFLKEKYKNYNPIIGDGIRVETENFWFAVRKSNTEDVVRVYLESKNLETNRKIRNEIKNDFQEFLKYIGEKNKK